MIADYRQLVNRNLPLIERGCTSKAGFVSRSKARNLSRRGRTTGDGLEAYHCQWCDLWHLGHPRRRH